MKKTITAIIITLLLLWIGYAFLPYIIIGKINNYDPYTFEKITGDSVMRADYGIGITSKPEDYGFKSEEINFQSLDGTLLNSWYVPAKRPSNHCIVLIHGRTSNRLKTMKYLALIDSLDLDTLYNVFIPDLRNSGKSQASKTYMGYKFGEDVAASLLMLNAACYQDTFLIYGFSMGAMAVLNGTGRPDLVSKYNGKTIYIEKIILDSPLVNVKETLRDQAKNVFMATMFFEDIFSIYSNQIHGFGENMSVSKLLNPTIPTLILQSKDDHTTKLDILNSELSKMKDFHNLEIVYFEGPDHVRIFQDARTKLAYIKTVKNFLNGK